MVIIREASEDDLDGLLALYGQLHNNPPEKDDSTGRLWQRMLNDDGHHVIVADDAGVVVSSCVVTIIPNLTQRQHPYALVENVVTAIDRRNTGLGTKCLEFAKDIAIRNGCYKIMLMTGSKDDHVMRFYENAGYNRNDKTAFIQWIPQEGLGPERRD